MNSAAIVEKKMSITKKGIQNQTKQHFAST